MAKLCCSGALLPFQNGHVLLAFLELCSVTQWSNTRQGHPRWHVVIVKSIWEEQNSTTVHNNATRGCKGEKEYLYMRSHTHTHVCRRHVHQTTWVTWVTHQPGRRTYQRSRACYQTTCETRSFGSVSVYQSCPSRLLTLSPDSRPAASSWPGSCGPPSS